MKFNDYQVQVLAHARYPGTVSYTALGLCGEAGEFAEKLKKILRDDGGAITPAHVTALTKELGDVLWYIAAAASELGVELEDVAVRNLEKIAGRRRRGTLGGSGDDR